LWISLSEFIRNEFLLRDYWHSHYAGLGLSFPSEPVNGAIWGLWSLLFAILIYIITRRFNFWQSVFIAWFAGFVLMWVVTGNMLVLPLGLLPFAIPLSILETLLAAWIITKMS
jgi:ABC-type Co2+ transport system permease subunit